MDVLANKRFPVVFVFDDNFVQAASVAITSLIRNKNQGTEYRIYIVSPGFCEESKRILKKFECEPWNTEVILVEVSTDKYVSIYKQFDGNMGAGSITALLKFDIPQAVDEPVALYLDADIMVKKDLSELFSLDLADNVAAVVKDSGKIYNKGGLRERIDNYFNSGVMLLNLDMMRSENYTEKLVQAKMSLEDIKLVDQDAFNLAFEGRTITIPVKYNCLWINLTNSSGRFTIVEFNRFYGTNYSCLWDLEDDASIIHFASKEKPWKYYDSPYAYQWMELYDVGPSANHPIERTNFFEKKPEFKEIPIILAADANYAPQTGVTILSALENRESDTPYRFFILAPEPFNEEILNKYHQIEEIYGNCSIEVIQMGDVFKTISMNIPHISFPTFYRLMAPELFPQYDKLIYLDSDVAVEGDLQDYYSMDLTGYYLGGVLAASFHWAPNGNRQYCEENGIPAIDQYINAGVILMNLAEMRRDHLQEKFLELVPLGLRCQDQDILNRVCYGHIRLLPYRYNAMIAKYEPVPEQNKKIFSDVVINEGNNRPVIIHYAAEIKPWASMSCALADRWWKYAMASPFFEEMRDRFYGKLIENGKNDRLNRAIVGNKPVFGTIKRKKNVNTDYNQKIRRFDELWAINDPLTYGEMYEICSSQVRLLNPQFMARLARLYRDGKGVEKNHYKALRLMKFAYDANIRWAIHEYVDLLLSVDDEQSAVEAYEICVKDANNGDPFIQCRLARMYRDGKGVGRNVDEAIRWMRGASHKNSGYIPELVKLLMYSKDDDHRSEAFSICSREDNSSNKMIVFRLAQMHRDGCGVEKNLLQAAELMRVALGSDGPIGARWELFDILWTIGTPESREEAVHLAKAGHAEGIPQMTARLARCYRDGKGVDIDLCKAAELMRTASESGSPRWTRWELFDILWAIGTPESLEEAVRLAEAGHAEGIPQMTARLARCYRDSKGVEKDLQKAIELMKGAANQGYYLAKREYFDLLWEIDTSQSLEEMIQFAMPLADAGDASMQGRLARAYRDGKGVDRNLKKAAELMKKAAESNVPWAEREYQSILRKIEKKP